MSARPLLAHQEITTTIAKFDADYDEQQLASQDTIAWDHIYARLPPGA